jgi:hypothetical protein
LAQSPNLLSLIPSEVHPNSLFDHVQSKFGQIVQQDQLETFLLDIKQSYDFHAFFENLRVFLTKIKKYSADQEDLNELINLYDNMYFEIQAPKPDTEHQNEFPTVAPSGNQDLLKENLKNFQNINQFSNQINNPFLLIFKRKTKNLELILYFHKKFLSKFSFVNIPL